MALAIAKVVPNADTTWGNKKVKVRDITFDNSYPDNGEALTASQVGLRKIEQAIPNGPARAADGSTAVVTAFDLTNSKVIAYESGASGAVLPEKGDTESLDGYVQRWTFVGV